MKVDIRKRIVALLRKHPEGLPILEISRLVDAHRHTVTKYIYELVGADVIEIRKIGTVKLCLLKPKFAGKAKQKKVLEKLKERVE